MLVCESIGSRSRFGGLGKNAFAPVPYNLMYSRDFRGCLEWSMFLEQCLAYHRSRLWHRLDSGSSMEMKQDSRILYCHCAYAEILPPQVKREVRQALRESGLSYDAVLDLCELAARKAPLLAELAGAARLTIAACHPRAVKWLFAAGGAPLRDEGVEYLDMREISAEQLLRSIRDSGPGRRDGRTRGGERGHAFSHGNPESMALEGENSGIPAWKPWFPVIDYERCGNCQQCLGFCLFGVYGVGSDGKVQVKNPANCKTDCPACARVCPETAIIFPKYANAPINGGEAKESEPLSGAG